MRKVLMLALAAGCFSVTRAQNLGFENGLASWQTSSNGTVAITTATNTFRTGLRAAQIITPASSTDFVSLTNNGVNTGITQSGRFLHVVTYARTTTTAAGAEVRVGVIDNLGNTIFQPSWTPISTAFRGINGAFAVQAGRSYRLVVAARTSTTAARTIHIDDAFMYEAASNSFDNTNPTAPTAISVYNNAEVNKVNFSFTAGADEAGGSGNSGILVARITGFSALQPTPQSHVMYSNVAVNGPSNIPFNFQVRYNGAMVREFSDSIVPNTNYTYLFFNRDVAGNYTLFGGGRAFVVNSNASTAASFSLDGLGIRPGANLTLGNGTVLTLKNDAVINVWGKITHTAGTFITDANGTDYDVNFKNGSEYEYANGATQTQLVRAFWEKNSTCRISGVTTATSLGGLNQSFGNFIWSCTNQSSVFSLPTQFQCSGGITIASTGSSGFFTFPANGNTQIGGNFTHTGGRVVYGADHKLLLNGNDIQEINAAITNFDRLEINNTSTALATPVRFINNATVNQELNLSGGGVLLQRGMLTIRGALIGSSKLHGTDSSGIAFRNGLANANYVFSLNSNAARIGRILIELTGSNGRVTLAENIRLTGGLFVNAGSLHTENRLTFASTADSTAYVAPVTGAIVGSVIVERYIPSAGFRGFRMVSAPVTAGSIYNNWQERGTQRNGYGTLVTGGSTANGFDAGSSGASIFRYDGSISPGNTNVNVTRFVALNNTNNANPVLGNGFLAPGTGYLIFIRGDRNTSNFIPTNSNNTTLRANGTLYTGPIYFKTGNDGTQGTPPLPMATGRFTLIGNPYQATIDWASSGITKTGIANTMWVWDPTINNRTGGWAVVSFNAATRNYTVTPSTSNVNTRIQPGQAFLIQSNTVSPALTITEQAKVVNSPSQRGTIGFRNGMPSVEQVDGEPTLESANSAVIEQVSAQLTYAHNSQTIVADEVLQQYHSSFSKFALPNEDVIKLNNSQGENLALVKENRLFTIDRTEALEANDSLLFNIRNLRIRNYNLQVQLPSSSAFTNKQCVVVDNFLQTETTVVINTNGIITYPFQTTADSTSRNGDRFTVRLSNKLTPAATVAITNASCKVYPTVLSAGTSIQIQVALLEPSPMSMRVTGTDGRVVLQRNLGTYTQLNETISWPNGLGAGMYTVTIFTDSKEFTTSIIQL